MTQQKATNVQWHHGEVTRDDRFQLMGQRGTTLWFTGLSGSGKSTVAVALESRLYEFGKLAYRLDGDNVRLGINKNLGFSAADRTENIRRIGEVGNLYVDGGFLTLASFVSPYREDRDGVRALMDEGDFVEIFIDTPVELCEARDPKGLYKKARAGEIPNFTGVADPYEAPKNAEMVIKTADGTPEEAAAQIIAMLEHMGKIKSA